MNIVSILSLADPFSLTATATGSLSATLGPITLAGTGTFSAIGNAQGALSATLGAITLVGAATYTSPPPATGTLAATLGPIVLGSVTFTGFPLTVIYIEVTLL